MYKPLNKRQEGPSLNHRDLHYAIIIDLPSLVSPPPIVSIIPINLLNQSPTIIIHPIMPTGISILVHNPEPNIIISTKICNKSFLREISGIFHHPKVSVSINMISIIDKDNSNISHI